MSCNYTTFHPYIKLYLVKWSDVWLGDKELAIGDDDNGVDINNVDDTSNANNTDNSDSNTGSHSLVTTHRRIHHTLVHYNDFKADIPIPYLSTSDYNNFVAAKGGIITDSAAYANSKTFYIESINLSISGSTMVLVQLEEFDNTLKAQSGEMIYGYILNNDGDTQPAFAGYVNSISRRLGESGQEIVYTCKDFKFYFNQLYTPTLYQKEDSLRTIINDILIEAGVTYFENNLPDITLKAKWQSAPLTQVLDWACNISGDYWYWIDKNGKLHIDKLNGTNHDFHIPSIGESVGDNKVLNFSSLTDLSNSRSRIVVTGGSGSKIYEKSVNTSWSKPQIYSCIQEAIDRGVSGEIGVLASVSPGGDTKTYLADDGNFTVTPFGYYEHKGDNYIWYKDPEKTDKDGNPEYYHTHHSFGSASYDHYYIIRKKNVEFYSEMIAEGRSAWVDNYIYPTPNTTEWVSESGLSIQNDTIKGDAVVYAKRSYGPMVMHFAEKDKTQDLSVVVDTGNPGGVYVYKDARFRYIAGLSKTIDDTPIMQIIATNLANYYKPIYGGQLDLTDLQTLINLGDTISLSNTSLPAKEASDLKVFEIRYNLHTQTTTLSLSTKMNGSFTGVDREMIRLNIDYYRQIKADRNDYIVRENVHF